MVTSVAVSYPSPPYGPASGGPGDIDLASLLADRLNALEELLDPDTPTSAPTPRTAGYREALELGRRPSARIARQQLAIRLSQLRRTIRPEEASRGAD